MLRSPSNKTLADKTESEWVITIGTSLVANQNAFNIIKDLEFVKVYIRYPAKCFDNNYQFFFYSYETQTAYDKVSSRTTDIPGNLSNLIT